MKADLDKINAVIDRVVNKCKEDNLNIGCFFGRNYPCVTVPEVMINLENKLAPRTDTVEIDRKGIISTLSQTFKTKKQATSTFITWCDMGLKGEPLNKISDKCEYHLSAFIGWKMGTKLRKELGEIK